MNSVQRIDENVNGQNSTTTNGKASNLPIDKHFKGCEVVEEFDIYSLHEPTLVPPVLVAPERVADGPEQTGNEPAEERNPLEVVTHTGLELGWIDDYCKLAGELTTSPRSFHELSALTTAATAIQRRGYIQMGATRIAPNIYGCPIAESTSWGKTQAIYFPRQILEDAGMDNLMIPAQITSEGLIKSLAEHPNALMIRDEIGTLFGSDKVKHLRDLKQDLTRIYDGHPADKRLAGEEIKVPRPYLNILGATTPTRFYENTSHADWEDGLLPRWLFAVAPEGQKPDFRRAAWDYTADHGIRRLQLAETLRKIGQQQETRFIVHPRAFIDWNDWKASGQERAYDTGDHNAVAICGRYGTYALKFAVILAALNGDWGNISIRTMDTAIKLADNYKYTVSRIIARSGEYKVTGDKLQRVFNVIRVRSTKGENVTIGVIQRYTNMRQNELRPCIDELTNSGAISTDASGRFPRYITNVEKLPLRK